MLGDDKQVNEPGKIRDLVKMMIADICNSERELVGEQIGSYNRKFAEKWARQFTKIYGEEATNVDRMSTKQFLQVLGTINQKMNESMGNLG